MTLEQLKAKGLTDEQAQEILKLHKEAIDGNYVPKATLEAERAKLKTANDTIAERDKQIKNLGAFEGTVEQLQQQVQDLTNANEQKDKEYKEKLKDMEESTAIRTAIAEFVYSVDDVMPKLDRTKLTFKDGKVVEGLDDQIKAIKEQSPHYFKQTSTEEKNTWPNGWSPFGKSPDESKEGKGANVAVDFGKQLAKAFTQNDSVAQKANELYFK